MTVAQAAVLQAELGAGRLQRAFPLGRLTTFRIGGDAEMLVEARNADELVRALRAARALGVPVTLLGGGSNVLVSDAGVPGLVVRAHGGTLERVADDLLRADAGVSINGLVRYAVQHGLAGLAAWAGTPGSVGGAVFGNAHFDGRWIAHDLVSVRLFGASGEVSEVGAAQMEFAYDASRLQRTREVLVSAAFRVSPGDPAAERERARQSLAFRKRTQPLQQPSAGCIFKNPEPDDPALPPGMPASAGALIERAGLKGSRIGGASVSPVHANFFVNEGGALASDVARLIDRVGGEVEQRFGVRLREEIVRLGSS